MLFQRRRTIFYINEDTEVTFDEHFDEFKVRIRKGEKNKEFKMHFREGKGAMRVLQELGYSFIVSRWVR